MSSLQTSKRNLRKKFSTKFGIHGSNNIEETKRDLSLLLGYQHYHLIAKKKFQGEIKKISRNISGSDGWEDMREFFITMNDVIPYSLLKNFEDFIPELASGNDIDILVESVEKFSLIAKAVKKNKFNNSSTYSILINGQYISFDVSFLGDGYFDEPWQRDCLMDANISDLTYFKTLNHENQYYFLLYHVLIHKKVIPKKYVKFFKKDIETLKQTLFDFLHSNNYKITEPKDLGIYFNKNHGGDIKLSRARNLKRRRGLVNSMKKIIFKLGNPKYFFQSLKYEK